MNAAFLFESEIDLTVIIQQRLIQYQIIVFR